MTTECAAAFREAADLNHTENTAFAAHYDYGDDLVRMDRGSGAYYYLYDGLGSTRQLVNPAGAVTDSYGYSAFGEMASRTGSTQNPFLFNAQQFDGASGDYYLRTRYYDQTSGRFISQDSFEGVENDPISLHRYLYASIDPVNRDDPGGEYDGLVSISFASISAAIVQGGYDRTTVAAGAGLGALGSLYLLASASKLTLALARDIADSIPNNNTEFPSVRFQLQRSVAGVTLPDVPGDSITLSGYPDEGVTVSVGRAALEQLFLQSRKPGHWYPKNDSGMTTQIVQAVVELSEFLGHFIPYGKSDNVVINRNWEYKGKQYRIDIENQRGTNFRVL